MYSKIRYYSIIINKACHLIELNITFVAICHEDTRH